MASNHHGDHLDSATQKTYNLLGPVPGTESHSVVFHIV